MDTVIPISEAELKRNRKVFHYVFQDRSVWVKKRRSPENLLGWHVQRILYRLTGILLALPPGRPAEDNIDFEIKRLRQAREAGVRVPDILYRTEAYFVLQDTGCTLEHLIRAGDEQAGKYIEDALRALRRLHDAGLAHGGAQIKNITICEGLVVFIDFEERIPGERLPLYQLRDLFLFFLSLERRGADFDLRHLCGVYGGTDADAVTKRVVSAILQLRLVRMCQWRVFSSFSMRDIRAIACLVERTERLYAEMH